MTNNSIVATGSIRDVSKTRDTALALMDAKIVLLCDRSGSMAEIARGHKASYQIEDEVVAKFQARHPGKVVLIAFNDVAWMCLDGNLPLPGGSTNMLDAFRVAKPLADIGLRIVLNSPYDLALSLP